jgi:hypothetical protein
MNVQMFQASHYNFDLPDVGRDAMYDVWYDPRIYPEIKLQRAFIDQCTKDVVHYLFYKS